jgi:hypothetical protein
MKRLGLTIQARLGGYLNAYACCTNLTELENSLGDVLQMTLKRLYRDGLGINLKALDAPARTFLGLT